MPKDTQEMLNCPLKIERQQKTPVIDRWYKKQDKKENQEVQNTLLIKFGGKIGPQKCQLFHKYEQCSYVKLILKNLIKKGSCFSCVMHLPYS